MTQSQRHHELSGLVGYQLHFTNLIGLSQARTALAKMQTTPAKVTALLFLRDNPGCDQTSLGRFLSVNRSGAMKLVNTLSARGLVERHPGRDLRSHGLRLTDEGGRFLVVVLDILQSVERELCALISGAERTELLRLLSKVRDAVALPGHKDQQVA